MERLTTALAWASERYRDSSGVRLYIATFKAIRD
jgi:hypothetical protein